MTNLSKEDKIAIINQHKKNIEYSKYNLEVSIIEENAVSNPNQDSLNFLNEQISDLNNKLSALDAEIASL